MGVSWLLSFKAIAEYFLAIRGLPGGCTQEFTLLLLQKGLCVRVYTFACPREVCWQLGVGVEAAKSEMVAAVMSTFCLLHLAPGRALSGSSEDASYTE